MDSPCTSEDSTGAGNDLAVVAHELRAPLTSLRLLIEDLLEGLQGMRKIDSRWLDEAFAIHRIAIDMASMLDNLVDSVRLEQSELEWGPVDLARACTEVVDLMRPQALPDVQLDINIDEGARIMHGNAPSIRRLLTNLLANACRHTTRGCIAVSTCREDAEWLTVCVSDTGCGIDAPMLGRVGEAFARGSHARGGSGLGLWICRAIAAAHGGSLRIASTRGIGTRIEARLKMRLLHPATRESLPPIEVSRRLADREAA